MENNTTMRCDHIIHARWIIPCEPNTTYLEHHALVIKDNKIMAIIPSKEANRYHAETTHHYFHHAVLPGFINTHTHIGMNLFRGIANDLPLMTWLKDHIWPTEGRFVSHELVYDASLLAMAEMLRSGTTCFNEMYFFPEATAHAAKQAHIRAFIGMTIINVPTAWAKTAEDYLVKGLAFGERYLNHPLITPTFAPHAIYTVADDFLKLILTEAEKHHLQINMHVHETEDEIKLSIADTGKRPLLRLTELGLVSDRLIAVHMTQLNDEDKAILHELKPHIVHCPESNMKLASGTCPVSELLENNINVALGTDGVASNNDVDMIAEMRTAAFLAKLSTRNPASLPALETLRMATLHGAKALKIDHLTGSLLPGKSADFISIDLDQIETQPLYDPIAQIVYAASRNQVNDVWVAGKQVLKNRKLTTLDEESLIAKAHEWAEKVKQENTTKQYVAG